MKLRFDQLLVANVILFGIIISFQNCSSQYKSKENSSVLASQINTDNTIDIVMGGPYPSSTLGTVYYFVDCGEGASLDCTKNIGNDSNPGTNANQPFKTSVQFQQVFNDAKPGDQILFAQCGAWSSMQTTLYNTYSAIDNEHLLNMTANPVIIGSYRPIWCQTGVRPILQGTTGLDIVMNFTTGSSGKPNGGFILRDLLFQGAGYYNNSALNFLRWPRNVMIDNLIINNFGGGGITCGGQPAYGYPDHITIRNSKISNSGKLGLGFFGCNNVLIENNKFDNNGFDDGVLSSQPINQNHQLYISGTDANDGSITTGVVVRGNKFTNSSMKDGRCQSTVIVGHDVASDWLIENNVIYQPINSNAGGCWGIGFSPANGGYMEGMDRLIIRGNTLINVGNVGVQLAACRNCAIENNILIWTSADNGGVNAIRFNHAITSPAYVGSQLMIRNNSIYFNQSADVSHGIVINDDGINHSVVSNLIYFGSENNIAANCFDTNLATSAFSAWDNNSCYHYTNWISTYSKLETWRKVSGFDLNSINSDPLLIGIPSEETPSNISLQAASPAIDRGHPSLSTLFDMNHCTRNSTPDIGAFEYLTAVCVK